ncbi:MAG: rhodanese-like domain-containing protein [Bacteroidales bacterium]|nr:rhodanese-like domain-containing protein [Bacteroidales bacterium]
MMEEQIRFYEQKLQFEMDSWDLFDAISRGDNVQIVDARSVATFEKEHIPNALNIPHRTMNEETTAHLDKETLYVVYCDGIGCNASTKGSLNLTRLGFNVKELLGGIDWWKRDGYKTEGSDGISETKIECGC